MNTDIFDSIFNEILNQINEKGLINKKSIFVDSTHTKAYANKKKIENKIVEESYNKYVSILNDEINEIRKLEGKKPLAVKTKKEIISTTDPECGMFHKGEKEKQLAYSTQVACDKSGWVTGCKVYPGNLNDNNTAPDFLQELLNDEELENVVMDAGYTSPIVLNQILEKGKKPIIPYTRPKGAKKKNKNDLDTPFNSTSYKFDKKNNCYICPMGINLSYRGLNSEGKLVFKSRNQDCKNCPFKNKCTNQPYKEIQRHLLEHAADYAREIILSELGKELYPLRKTTIERCFAQTKFNNNLGFTFLRGCKKNQDRVLVIFAMHNLSKLANMTYKRTINILHNLKIFFKKVFFFTSIIFINEKGTYKSTLCHHSEYFLWKSSFISWTELSIYVLL